MSAPDPIENDRLKNRSYVLFRISEITEKLRVAVRLKEWFGQLVWLSETTALCELGYPWTHAEHEEISRVIRHAHLDMHPLHHDPRGVFVFGGADANVSGDYEQLIATNSTHGFWIPNPKGIPSEVLAGIEKRATENEYSSLYMRTLFAVQVLQEIGAEKELEILQSSVDSGSEQVAEKVLALTYRKFPAIQEAIELHRSVSEMFQRLVKENRKEEYFALSEAWENRDPARQRALIQEFSRGVDEPH